MAKGPETTNTATINLIGAGTSITGDIISDGDIRIDGVLKGNLKIKGKVVIGETGSINGEIDCKNSDVSGNIKGKIIVTELLSLKSTSSMEGEITANKLAIEPGAKFSGSCNMSSNSSKITTEYKKPEESTKA